MKGLAIMRGIPLTKTYYKKACNNIVKTFL
jgi:hypothetical protein